MRISVLIAPLAILFAQPASATTIIQTSANYEAVQGGFSHFDPTLGTLDKVTLEVAAHNARFAYTSSPYPTEPVLVEWAIDGIANLMVYDYSLDGNFAPIYLTVPISGTGSEATIYGIPMVATGFASFDLDPAIFQIDTVPNDPFDIAIRHSVPGFYTGDDVTFQTSAPLNISAGGGVCSSGSGDEWCNGTRYTLIYDYTPFAVIPGVPEPGTWAMMLIGFGLLGGAMRSTRRRGKLAFSNA